MIPIEEHDNPVEVAEKFAAEKSKEGYHFDFSLKSLETEVDKLLANIPENDNANRHLVEVLLTAYIGETFCRLFNGKWSGIYFGPDHIKRVGVNYYLCKISINEADFYPSHIIGYLLIHRKTGTSTFKDRLYKNKSIQQMIQANTKQ